MRTVHGTSAVLSGPGPVATTTPARLIGTQDDGRRLAAAQAAGLHAFVRELPEGYHTPVGEDGVVLSPGQRLRFAVATLIAADPRSVVVDDPTAGLDRADEAALLPVLESLFRGREVSVVNASPPVRAAITRMAGRQGASATITPPRAPSPPDDPHLPGAARLLDAAEMRPLLATMLAVPCLDVRVHSTRYKPGKNLLVEYGVRTEDGWSTAVAFTNNQTGLERKSSEQARTGVARRVGQRHPDRTPVGYLPEVSALVQWMPLDLRLPVLADEPERLTRRLAKKQILVDPAEPELLRYWPRRRAVLRVGSHILKLYRDQRDFEEALHALRLARKLSLVPTPRYEGRLKARQVTVQQWLPGGSPSLGPAGSEPAGRVLADLHADRRLKARRTTPQDLLRKAASRGRFVTELLPGLRSDVARLVADLEAARLHEGATVTSHGNFHAGQLLAAPEGLAVIDVDRMCRAAPAYDIASFASHLAFGQPGERAVLEAALDSLLVGYGAHPPDLAWYLSTCLLRRAAVPFRYQDVHWPETTAQLVQLAREVLG